MKKSKIKLIALTLLLTTTLGIFSACSGDDRKPLQSSSKSTVSSASKADDKSKGSDDKSSDEKSGSDTSKTDESKDESKEERKKEPVSDVTDDKEKGPIPDLPKSDGEAQTVEGILVYNRMAFEKFYGYDSMAEDYGKTMSKLADYLGSDIKIYNVLVPTHCGISLPDSIMEDEGLPNQNDYINKIIDSYSTNDSNKIIGVNTYDTLMHHRDEYIYLNTDHHWSGLGAYYAYKDFCKAAGVDYVKLSELEKGQIEGYYGSLTNYIPESLVDPDTVEYYKTDKDITTTLYDNDGTGGTSTNIIHSYADSSFAYGVFLGGDNGLMVSKNKDGNGKKIAVVKESYGNAFCPYIAYTYGETHMIDFRYITFDFKKYLEDNDIHEVIFINNNMATATPARCEDLENLIK